MPTIDRPGTPRPTPADDEPANEDPEGPSPDALPEDTPEESEAAPDVAAEAGSADEAENEHDAAAAETAKEPEQPAIGEVGYFFPTSKSIQERRAAAKQDALKAIARRPVKARAPVAAPGPAPRGPRAPPATLLTGPRAGPGTQDPTVEETTAEALDEQHARGASPSTKTQPAAPLSAEEQVYAFLKESTEPRGPGPRYSITVANMRAQDVRRVQFIGAWLADYELIPVNHPTMIVKYALNFLLDAIRREIEKQKGEGGGEADVA